MREIVDFSLNHTLTVEALHALDAGKRYKPKMTARKSALLTALTVLIMPRLRAGKREHTFTKKQVAEVAQVSEKTAYLAIMSAKQAGILIPVAEAKYRPSTGGTAPGRYIMNFDFVDQTVPSRVEDFRLAAIRSGSYGEDWVSASEIFDNQLEMVREIIASRGYTVLTVKRIIEVMAEIDEKRWARVLRRARFWNWGEDQ